MNELLSDITEILWILTNQTRTTQFTPEYVNYITSP